MDAVLQVGTPIALLIAWQLFSNAEVINPRWFPPPTQVARAMRIMIENGLLWDALVVSARRIALGYLLGSAVGVIVGLILGRIRSLRVAFEPVISALYTVPKLALLPLMLLVFGLGDLPKVLLIALSVFFIVVIATLSAVVDVPGAYLEPARSFDATELQTMRHVILPSIIPPVFVALRIAAGTAVLVLIGVEFVQGGKGLGWMIWNSWQLFMTDRMYVGIVTTSLLGVVFQSIVKRVGQWIAPWSTADVRANHDA